MMKMWELFLFGLVSFSPLLALGEGPPAGKIEVCGASDGSNLLGPKPTWNNVSQLLLDANVLNTQFSSEHVIVINPTVPYNAGGVVAARAFAKLPRSGAMSTKMTKVVVVGHVYGAGGGDGILIGADVCDSRLVDQNAVDWLKNTVPTRLGKPTVLDAGACSEKINPSLEQALPFLSGIFSTEDGNRTLEGHVLPIMLQHQSADMGKEIGDALHLLVAEEGVYQDERVLFVFGGDMSHNLGKDVAAAVDKTTLDKILGSGFGPVANYVADLKAKDVADPSGDPLKLKTQAPFGFVTVLGALRLAGNMGMQAQLMNRANSGEYEGNTMTNALEPVRGYGSVVFTLDTRPVAQQMGSGPEERKFPTETTTTTTFTTTQMVTAPEAAEFNPDPRMGMMFLKKRQNATSSSGAVVQISRHNWL